MGSPTGTLFRVRTALVMLTLAVAVLQACSSGSMSGNLNGPPLSVRWPPAVLPLPREMTRLPGVLALPPSVAIRTNGTGAAEIAVQLKVALEKLGVEATVDNASTAPLSIHLTSDAGLPHIGAEGYDLEVNQAGIVIAANKEAGLFYGVETFEQLLSDDGRSLLRVPDVKIIDWPEYSWRGLHLDVSRHFFPVEFIKRYIDVAARLKLNTFHWHLTDDQGWRIDIPQYPRLVSVGACRDATQTGTFESQTNDGTPSCSYYSRQEVRDVVAYARARDVRVVPEIEGPGHSVEVLAAYPELACAPGPFATLTHWGSTRYALCPTEVTFEFYDNVFRELATLFPGPFIQIGGDEVSYYSWRNSHAVSVLMRRQGLSSYAQVEGYFTHRIELIAKKYGKRIVAWDDIAKTDTPSNAIIMVWTDPSAGWTASSQGNDVVMTPGPPLYFDAYQGPPEGEPPAIGGFTTLWAVYQYDPGAFVYSPAQRKHILGAQGNVWTEYIPTSAQVWYMTYPRALALAELCWTPRSRMDWADFTSRAGVELQRLEPLGVKFRIPASSFRIKSPAVAPVVSKTNVYRATLPAGSHGAIVEVERFVPNSIVQFTLDGSLPNESSQVYKRPLYLKTGSTLRVVATLKGYRSSTASSLSIFER